jgi:uncharacterized membrane protein YhhN
MHKRSRYLFFTASLLEVIRNLFEWDFEHFTKPLIIITLLLYFITSGVKKGRVYWGVIIALVFSWFGDSLLMYETLNPIYFIGGLLSFLLAHITYAMVYSKARWKEATTPLLPSQKLRHGFTITLAGLALIYVLESGLGEMKIPVMVYATVLVIMTIMALFRFGFTSIKSFGLVFGGAITFMISDSLLAVNKFLDPFSNSGFWIMSTYCLAQYLIIEGMIQHLKNEKRA